MSLKIDVYDEGEWSTLREITPRNGLVPMQSVENGRPVLYALECSEDDSRSTIYRLPVGIETSHSTVFKQWFRECELLKDSQISACHRL